VFYLTRYVARGMRTPILKDLYHFCRLFDASVDVSNGTSLSDAANCSRTRRSQNARCSDGRPGEASLKLVPFVDVSYAPHAMIRT
jgi:hypothetical protein